MSIFVIDDHPLMREAVAGLIRRMSLTATELDSLAAVAAAVASDGEPELISLEILVSGVSTVAGLAQLRQQFPKVPIVVLSAADPHELEEETMQAGASAYLHKSASATEISGVLRSFLSGGQEPLPAAPGKLSKRQKQLLLLLDKGMSNRDIAEALQISEHTVKVHLGRLFRRLNVKSRSQASHLARTQGML